MIDRRHALQTFAAFALAACTKHETTEGGARALTLALDWVPEPEFGGFYAAREQGLFKNENLEVTIRAGGAGVPVVQMVATGNVELGVIGADELLKARSRGADVVPLFATYQTSPQGLMAHASRGAKSIADLTASGTLAIEPGLAYAAFLKKKLGDFKAKVVPYDGGVARFLADKDLAQQCYVTSEPIAAKKKGGDPQVFLIADEGFNPYVGVVIAKRSFVAEQAEIAKAFVRAARAGWRAYLDDPRSTNAALARLDTAMDAETMSAAAEAQKPLIETEATKKDGLGSMSRERWSALHASLVDLKILEAPIDLAPLSSFRL